MRRVVRIHEMIKRCKSRIIDYVTAKRSIMPYTVGRCIRWLTVERFKSSTVRGTDMMRWTGCMIKQSFQYTLIVIGGEQYTLPTIALVSLTAQIGIQCFLDYPRPGTFFIGAISFQSIKCIWVNSAVDFLEQFVPWTLTIWYTSRWSFSFWIAENVHCYHHLSIFIISVSSNVHWYTLKGKHETNKNQKE